VDSLLYVSPQPFDCGRLKHPTTSGDGAWWVEGPFHKDLLTCDGCNCVFFTCTGLSSTRNMVDFCSYLTENALYRRYKHRLLPCTETVLVVCKSNIEHKNTLGAQSAVVSVKLGGT
jgi:hypothetical protein